MTNVRFRKSVVFATLFLCVFVSACSSQKGGGQPTVSFSGAIMGTTYHVTVVGELSDASAEETARLIEAALKQVDRKMSTYKPDSELSMLNTSPGDSPIPISDELFTMLTLAQEVNRTSGGAFDITVGPLVNAWGFGPDALQEPPSEETLATLRALVGADKIMLEDNSVTKSASSVYCDLSGIAKGYAVDVVAGVLRDSKIDRFMVEVGGEVQTAGRNAAGVPWNIAIEKPVTEGRVLQEVVGLENMALATSGNYRNFYEVDGKRISHTIDPATGNPVEHSLASVSVLHQRCALADAYATALMVLGPEKGMALADRLNLPVMMVLHSEEGAFVTQQNAAFKTYVVE